MYERDLYIPPPCPVCAKPRGATMGSSAWGHDISCCGETCGLKMRDRLQELYQSHDYKQAVSRMTEAMGVVAEMKAKAVASFHPQN